MNSHSKGPQELKRAEVSDQDRLDFQRWFRATSGRYAATKGMRDRPGDLRPDHSNIVTGSVAIGKELREYLPLALAALALHDQGESSPLAFLRSWVGSFDDLAELAADLLEQDRSLVQQHGVFGLWCEDDACHRFIRPVAVRLASTPDSTFATTAVCAKCRSVTVIWGDDSGLWVRSAPELRGRNHPMRPHFIFDWVMKEQPPANREALLIAP